MNHQQLFANTPPGKLFFLAAIPGAIGMMASALYQLVDGAFVGHILGAQAFAAINLVMPLVVINFSLADLIGVGSSVPIAIKLGEGDHKSACTFFSSACLLIVLTSAVFGAILYTLAPIFLRMMGAQGELADLARQYMRVYAVCLPFTSLMFATDNYLRICGKIRMSMWLNIVSSVASIVLEFLFLSVLKIGIRGAALGTCLGMFLCTVVSLMPFMAGKLQLRFCAPSWNKRVLASIVKNGCPTFLNNVSGQITSILMNYVLLRIGGAQAVSVYGIMMYANGFIQPLLYGLCDSLQPAVGFNWGAKNYGRVVAIEKWCFAASAVLSILMTVAMLAVPEAITGIFVKPEETELFSLSVHAMSLFSFAYLVRWISYAAQSYLSAVGKAGYATAISVCTAFVFPVFLIVVLWPLKLNGLWLNFPVTALLAAAMSLILLIRFQKTIRLSQ